MGKRVERLQSIAWGIGFLAAAGACAWQIAIASHAAWSTWDWAWRVGGTVLLAAAGIGSLLPNLTAKQDASWQQPSAAAHVELDGFASTYDRTPVLAAAVDGLTQMDPGAAHVAFHTSRDGAWGVRLAILRLLHDRYAAAWSQLAADRMMNDLVARTTQDPCWLLLRAMRHVDQRRLREALADCDAAAHGDPPDPTPLVVKTFALRAMPDRRRAFELGSEAYAEAQRRAPELYEAHEQMLHLLAACDESPDGSADSMFQLARGVGQAVPEGEDGAFLPALAHYIKYARAVDDGRAHPDHLANQQTSYEIAMACRRSFDSPRYRVTHRTYRLLHVAAALHSVIGDIPRLRGELERAGDTFDLDIWSPFHPAYPAKAFLAARKQAGLA